MDYVRVQEDFKTVGNLIQKYSISVYTFNSISMPKVLQNMVNYGRTGGL